ncbi:hypothetical protein FHS57_006231 [Runella defluvii]|uniref:Phage portal protein n=1 Tax=Runella defluvii TaxID=370973 RepID=A0A7W5ZT26_9BACT|nr:hypothetical protein [Runella defluvii]MBB3842200.1 hypothetical protein [Runella defluvii]
MNKTGRIVSSSYEAAINIPGMDYRYDDNTGKGSDVKMTIGGEDVIVYPWGKNNKLPNDMISLLRTNGDLSNLLDTRNDFLFGAGVGLYKRVNDKKDVVFEPYFNADCAEYLLEKDITAYVDGAGTHIVECGTAFINVSKQKSGKKLIPMDPLTVRTVRLNDGEVEKSKYVVSSNWGTGFRKNGVIVPAYDYDSTSTANESIVQLMRVQSGQFYYGYPRWWASAEWIRLANRIPKFHNQALDTEYNVTHICRIADQYFETMFQIENIETEEEKEKYRSTFYAMIDDIVYNKEGKRRVLYDECPVGEDGKLHGWIELIPVPRTVKGNEYTELYQACVLAFANVSGVLSQLTGISDGKVVGGSGSELRVTAEYQQFYRTPRERELILKPLNRIILPEIRKTFNLPKDVVFGFNNILLEALNTAKTGSTQVGTGGQNATKQIQKTSQKSSK